jgi:hypothetical protein
MIIPEHIQLETINGMCTARCNMCAIRSWKRKSYVMEMDDFVRILYKFQPYQSHQKYLSLFGFGEPLLDKLLPARITVAKLMEFKSVGIATNCTELSKDMSMDLMKAGLDTLICSIDGYTAKTHESIRVGTKFDDVCWNVNRFLYLRNFHEQKTKVILRFVRQQSNAHEWEEYRKYWEHRLEPQKYGDAVLSLDVVDCDGKVEDYKNKDVLGDMELSCVCEQLYDRILVLSNGDVALCCGDDEGKFKLGNVLEQNPMEIYNNETFNTYRRKMEQGRVGELPLCNTCTIPRSMRLKDRIKEA